VLIINLSYRSLHWRFQQPNR